GRAFCHQTLKRMLLRACNAGYSRVVDGELRGRLPGDPILPEEEYLERRQVLVTQAKGRPPTKVHLLTGPNLNLLRCAVCKVNMQGTVNGTGVSNKRADRVKK